jgi:anti-sigma-K factor RskA
MGMTSADESAQVITWMENYPEVKEEVNRIEESLQLYGESHAAAPRPAVKQRLLKSIGNLPSSVDTEQMKDPSTETKTVRLFESRIAAAAAVLLLIGSVIFNLFLYNKNEKLLASNLLLKDENIKAGNTIASLNAEKNEMKQDMEIVQNRYATPVKLNGMEAAPDAVAKIFWMANTGDVYIDPSNLPDAPSGKQYQLWAIIDGKPVDGGMIVLNNNADKYRIHKMKAFGKAQAFAVTLEDMGGHPQPEGQMYVMGKL